MFEGIVLHRGPETGKALDAGLLAESLLFFQNVTVLLNFQNAISLISKIGPDIFFELIEQGRIKVSYSRNDLVILSETINGISSHKVKYLSFVSSGDHPRAGQLKRSHIEGMLERAGVPRFRIKEFYRRFNDSVKISDLSDKLPGGSDPIFPADDMADPSFYLEAVTQIVQYHAPSYLKENLISFEVIGEPSNFFIDTNINFAELKRHHEISGGGTNIDFTPAHLTSYVVNAQADLLLGGRYGFSNSTGEVSRSINQIRLNNLYQRLTGEIELPRLFQERVIGDVGDIRTAINSGERSFGEFMALLEKAPRFQDWLHKLHPDDDLVDEYYAEVTRQSWGEKLPAKIIKFGACTGAGLFTEALVPMGGLAAATGIGIGAADTFLLEHIIRGWRPSSFVSKIEDFLDSP